MLLNMRARSSRDLSLRRAMCQERISRPIAFIASVLTAGRNDTKCWPDLFLASRGRNVYPRNVNAVCSGATPVARPCSTRCGSCPDAAPDPPAPSVPRGRPAPDGPGPRCRSAPPRHPVALEPDSRELPCHPQVERIVGSPGESHPWAPTERNVTVSRHSALLIQSIRTRASTPNARIGPAVV